MPREPATVTADGADFGNGLRASSGMTTHRGSDAQSPRGSYSLGSLVLHPRRLVTSVHGRSVRLTRKEFALLWTMAHRPGKVFTRRELLRQVWGPVFVQARTVDVHLAKLRKKLLTVSRGAFIIETLWGIGYRVVVLPTSARRRANGSCRASRSMDGNGTGSRAPHPFMRDSYGSRTTIN